MRTPLRERLSTALATYRGLRAFTRSRLDGEAAHTILHERLERREANFLRVLSEAILKTPRNPCRQLLGHAGVGLEDVRALLSRRGLEAALAELRESGVYLSVEELKGLEPLVRGGRTFEFGPGDLLNPLAAGSYEVQTGGSRAAQRVRFGFEYLRQVNVNVHLASEVHGAQGVPILAWFPPPPAAAGLFSALAAPMRGADGMRWFTQTRPAKLGQFLAMYASLFLVQSFGRRVPMPEYLPLADAGRLVTTAARAVARHGGCVVSTYVSSATAMCRVALRRGVSLEGVLFLPSAEPLTESRRRLIEATGARVAVSYWITELGIVGSACPHRTAGHDEMHVWLDSMALVQPQPTDGHAARPTYFTPLLPTAPTAVINLDVGDAARLYRRQCDCMLGHAGLDLMVADVRSTRRITAQGMTLTAQELEDLVERVLPGRFGGHAGDYQIIEETRGTSTRIAILAAPRLGPLDSSTVKSVAYDYLVQKNALIGNVLRQADAVEVRREAPQMTSGVKVPAVLIRRSADL